MFKPAHKFVGEFGEINDQWLTGRHIQYTQYLVEDEPGITGVVFFEVPDILFPKNIIIEYRRFKIVTGLIVFKDPVLRGQDDLILDPEKIITVGRLNTLFEGIEFCFGFFSLHFHLIDPFIRMRDPYLVIVDTDKAGRFKVGDYILIGKPPVGIIVKIDALSTRDHYGRG
jgi:hypothetical protein